MGMTPSKGPDPVTAQAPQVPQVAQQGTPSFRDMWKVPFDVAFKLANSSGHATGSIRRIVDAGLLGMCIAFFIALLGQKQLDSSLTGAAVAFAITVPLLVNSYLFVSSKVDQTVPGWRILGAVHIWAYHGEGEGEITAGVGLYFVLNHFATLAALVFLITAIVALGISAIFIIWAFIYFVVPTLRDQGQMKPKEQQTPAPPAPTSADAAP